VSSILWCKVDAIDHRGGEPKVEVVELLSFEPIAGDGIAVEGRALPRIFVAARVSSSEN
jgi:hypothetical protein